MQRFLLCVYLRRYYQFLEHAMNATVKICDNVFLVASYQSDSVAGFLERVNGHSMRNVDDIDFVHLEDGVIHTEAAVGGRGAARYQLGDVDGGVVADVRVVGTAGDTEPEPRTTSFQYNFFVLPLVVAIDLEQRVKTN